MNEAEPKALTWEHLDYLDDLRASGITNMWGARSHLMSEFPNLEEEEAGQVLRFWMKTFPREAKP